MTVKNWANIDLQQNFYPLLRLFVSVKVFAEEIYPIVAQHGLSLGVINQQLDDVNEIALPSEAHSEVGFGDIIDSSRVGSGAEEVQKTATGFLDN